MHSFVRGKAASEITDTGGTEWKKGPEIVGDLQRVKGGSISTINQAGRDFCVEKTGCWGQL